MYEGKEEKRCKGVKKSVVDNSINFDDKKCLFSGVEHYQKMYVIKSRKHEMFTEEVNKIVLSTNDNLEKNII